MIQSWRKTEFGRLIISQEIEGGGWEIRFPDKEHDGFEVWEYPQYGGEPALVKTETSAESAFETAELFC